MEKLTEVTVPVSVCIFYRFVSSAGPSAVVLRLRVKNDNMVRSAAKLSSLFLSCTVAGSLFIYLAVIFPTSGDVLFSFI